MLWETALWIAYGRALEKQGEMTMQLAKAALLFTMASAAWAQVNVGE